MVANPQHERVGQRGVCLHRNSRGNANEGLHRPVPSSTLRRVDQQRLETIGKAPSAPLLRQPAPHMMMRTCVTTTEAIRRGVQNSQRSPRELAARHSINPRHWASGRSRLCARAGIDATAGGVPLHACLGHCQAGIFFRRGFWPFGQKCVVHTDGKFWTGNTHPCY
jgi:hypothetical protein